MSWIENLHSANWNQAGGICLFAYVLGCMAAGYYLVRLLTDRDVRQIGSGSVGAKNVGRLLGKAGFFFTVLIDFSKGMLAVWAARQFTLDERLVALAMLAAVAGHIWPVQLRFHGGKGMATTLGALLVYDFQLAMTFAGLFLCLFVVLRRTVLPALFALAVVPLAAVWLGYGPARVVLLSAVAAVVLFAHRRNLSEEIAHLAGRRTLHPKPHQSKP